jgi:hypothetical protein
MKKRVNIAHTETKIDLLLDIHALIKNLIPFNSATTDMVIRSQIQHIPVRVPEANNPPLLLNDMQAVCNELLKVFVISLGIFNSKGSRNATFIFSDQMAKSKVSPALSFDEYVAIAGVSIFVLLVLYSIWKRYIKRSNKYVQDDPYVAKVDLHERYGGLEKRAVSIDDLDTETLILLERDGKLTQATIDKLRKQGRLPDPNKPNKLKKVLVVPAVAPQKVPVETSKKTPVKRKSKSKK